MAAAPEVMSQPGHSAAIRVETWEGTGDAGVGGCDGGGGGVTSGECTLRRGWCQPVGLSSLRESDMAPRTYGARFLQAFRQLGGSTKEWPSSVVDSVAAADRKAFIELVASRRTPIDAELSTAANVHEPEAVARRVFDRVERERQREQAQSSVFPMWPFGTGQ